MPPESQSCVGHGGPCEAYTYAGDCAAVDLTLDPALDVCRGYLTSASLSGANQVCCNSGNTKRNGPLSYEAALHRCDGQWLGQVSVPNIFDYLGVYWSCTPAYDSSDYELGWRRPDPSTGGAGGWSVGTGYLVGGYTLTPIRTLHQMCQDTYGPFAVWATKPYPNHNALTCRTGGGYGAVLGLPDAISAHFSEWNNPCGEAVDVISGYVARYYYAPYSGVQHWIFPGAAYLTDSFNDTGCPDYMTAGGGCLAPCSEQHLAPSCPAPSAYNSTANACCVDSPTVNLVQWYQPCLLRDWSLRPDVVVTNQDTEALVVKLYDDDDDNPVEAVVDAADCGSPSFWLAADGSRLEGVYLRTVSATAAQAQFAWSWDHGATWNVISISGSGYTAAAGARHKGRIVFLGYRAGSWRVRIGREGEDGSYTWSSEHTPSFPVTFDQYGHLRTREDEALEFVGLLPSGAPVIVTCFSMPEDGSGAWI